MSTAKVLKHMLSKRNCSMTSTSAAHVAKHRGKAVCTYGTVRLYRQPYKANCITQGEQMSGLRLPLGQEAPVVTPNGVLYLFFLNRCLMDGCLPGVLCRVCRHLVDCRLLPCHGVQLHQPLQRLQQHNHFPFQAFFMHLTTLLNQVVDLHCLTNIHRGCALTAAASAERVFRRHATGTQVD